MKLTKFAYFLLFSLCLSIMPPLTLAGETSLRIHDSEPVELAQLNLVLLVGTVTVRKWDFGYVKINSVLPSEAEEGKFSQRGGLISFADARLTSRSKRQFYRHELEIFVPSGTELTVSGFDVDLHIADGIEKLMANVSDFKLSTDGGLTLMNIDAITFEGHLTGATGALELKSEALNLEISDSLFEDISLSTDLVELDLNSTSADKFLLTAGTGKANLFFEQINLAVVDIGRGDIAVTFNGSLGNFFRIDSKLGNIYLAIEERIFERIRLSAESFNLINIVNDENIPETINLNRDRTYLVKESPFPNSPKVEAQTARGRIDIQLFNRAD